MLLLVLTKRGKKALSMIGKNFINYAVVLLFKDRKDHLFSFCLFALIIFVLSSVLFISGSIQHDLINLVKDRSSIVVSAFRTGKNDLMHPGYIYDISKIDGVSDVRGVVDGEYYFVQKHVWFHLYEDDSLKEDEMIVGEGVKAAMNELYYDESFNFLTEERMIPVKILKTMPAQSGLITNNAIFLHPNTLRAILNLKDEEYTKLYVEVPNTDEISEVALKIENLYPNSFALSIEDEVAKVRHLYYYKGGIFMSIYVSVMLIFFVLLKNQISLAYGSKKREIAILRSIGFCIKDIIFLKFIQNFIVSVSAFLLGVMLAYLFVFVFNAPLLKGIFLGDELLNFTNFTPILEFDKLFLIFVFGVIPFLAFVLIPSWRVASSDINEGLK